MNEINVRTIVRLCSHGNNTKYNITLNSHMDNMDYEIEIIIITKYYFKTELNAQRFNNYYFNTHRMNTSLHTLFSSSSK